MYGNIIVFNSGKRSEHINHEFPGRGLVRKYNMYNEQIINGFVYSS